MAGRSAVPRKQARTTQPAASPGNLMQQRIIGTSVARAPEFCALPWKAPRRMPVCTRSHTNSSLLHLSLLTSCCRLRPCGGWLFDPSRTGRLRRQPVAAARGQPLADHHSTPDETAGATPARQSRDGLKRRTVSDLVLGCALQLRSQPLS